MLTQEQIDKIKYKHGSDGFLGSFNMDEYAFANEIYAAGMAAGEAKERERCVSICAELESEAMSKQNSTDDIEDVILRHHALSARRCKESILKEQK